jgi:nicotinamidase-related amidase
MSDEDTNSVKHQHEYAILIIDMINALKFDDGDKLLKRALPITEHINKLKLKARAAGVPILYVNDNFGQWQSNWEQVYDLCVKENSLGRELTLKMKPEKDDYFVLKPKHSGFYSTTLEVLLESLGTKKLVITGVAGNICVLFTANDAYMREYEVIVPGDCIASNTEEDDDFTLRQLSEVFGIKTSPSTELQFR